jgi:Na+-translocating ferredoxin:NAD+ oxidoreductase RnfG subunit
VNRCTHWGLLPTVAMIISAPAHGTVYLTVEQAQQAIFPGARFDDAPVTLSDAEAKAIEAKSGLSVRTRDLRVWRVDSGGLFIVDAVIGKHEYITYAIGLNAGGSVRGLEIMDYRESYGYEIRNPLWRAQFTGKTAANPLKLDGDIKNISGATLSCRHITDAVKRMLVTYEIALK